MKLTKINPIITLFSMLVLIAGCNSSGGSGGGGGSGRDVLIDPSDSNALSEVLILPSAAQSIEGTPPPPTGTNQAPQVSTPVSSINSSNGSTSALPFSYSNAGSNLAGCYIQVDGAGNYYSIPYDSNSGNTGELQLPIGIPTNVNEGTFCVSFSIYDTNGFVSNVVNTCINVLRLGTGELQISLSWSNDTDQDLHVTDPSGEEIYWENIQSSTGGRLDRDDVDGFGPENIFWLENAPDGTYNVSVKDFDGTGEQNIFYVTVNSSGQVRSFNGATQNGSTSNVTSFTKNGDSLSFF